MPVNDGAYQSIEAVRGWRLDAERPASLACRHQQSIWPVFQRGYLAFQPTRESVGIVQRGLAKAEGVADLCPVIRGGPAAPVIAAPSFYRHLDLAGDRLDRRDGNLLKPLRKPTIGLEHLEQRRSPAFALISAAPLVFRARS